VLVYTRCKHAQAVDLEDGSVLTRAIIEDTYVSAQVQVVFQVPDMEIVSVKGDISRSFHDQCHGAVSRLEQVKGLFVGPGIIKSVNGLVGGPSGCPRLADLVLECCDQVIMRFTLGPLSEIVSNKGEDLIQAHREFLRKNPRMVGSCIAFAKDGPLARGL